MKTAYINTKTLIVSLLLSTAITPAMATVTGTATKRSDGDGYNLTAGQNIVVENESFTSTGFSLYMTGGTAEFKGTNTF